MAFSGSGQSYGLSGVQLWLQVRPVNASGPLKQPWSGRSFSVNGQLLQSGCSALGARVLQKQLCEGVIFGSDCSMITSGPKP